MEGGECVWSCHGGGEEALLVRGWAACRGLVEDCHCEQRRDAARDPGRGVPYVVTKFSLVKLGKDVR